VAFRNFANAPNKQLNTKNIATLNSPIQVLF